jgi:rRNA maturation RNase YbeY
MADVSFFIEGIAFKVPAPRKTKSWIRSIVAKENMKLKTVNFIFCSDEHLFQINHTFLNHSTYTDIITFDTGDTTDSIEGEIYISVDRVKENAESLNIAFQTELLRVMIHGILHLIGYNDKSKKQKLEMRRKEDECLAFY